MFIHLAAAVLALSGAHPAQPSSPIEAAADRQPETWTQWRGPDRTGQVTGPTWPSALTDHLEVQWRVADLGPSYAGPLIAADRVFTVETRGEADEVVQAYDRETGGLLWETEWPGAMKVPFFAAKNGSWVRSTPAYDGTAVYVGGMRDRLVCLEANDGAVRWSVDFGERHGTPLPSFGLVCSPLVDGEHLYIQAGAALEKMDTRTGETVWRSLEGVGGLDSAFSSPVIVELHGRRVVLVQTRTDLCVVAPEDGAVLAQHPIRAFRGMNILTPIAVGDSVFTAAYGGRSMLMDFRPGGKGEEGKGQDAALEPRWDHRFQGYMTSPVVIDGHAYFFTRANRFACLDLATGEDRWVSPPTGDDYWSIVAQGDRILALNDTGRLRLIAATPEAYTVLDEAEIADAQTWAHLTIAGEQIVVREQNALTLLRWQ